MAPTTNGHHEPFSFPPTDLYYGGEWHKPLSGERRKTYNPGDGSVVSDAIAWANEEDVDAAVEKAQAAFEAWAALAPLERAKYVRKAANILRQHADELAYIDSVNTGNPVSEMKMDAGMAADNADFFAGLAPMLRGETIPTGGDALNYTIREPLGVVGRIIAFNHPLMFAGSKLGAPLVAGNVVIIKPPEQAPLSCLRLAELIGHIFPPGVFNILSGGKECGQALTVHPLVRKITLIGSVPTGIAIQKAAAAQLKPTLLELGGKNALIAFPDSDPTKVAQAAVKGMNYTWAGQSCGSTSRLFLHESIYDQVIPLIVQLVAEKHTPGVPTDPKTTMGPLVSKLQQEKVLKYIESAHAEGAKLLTGGKAPTSAAIKNGFFVEATIFGNVTMDMRIAKEEIFGPVCSVLKWKDEAQLFKDVNSVDYGLTASIWTNDIITAQRAASKVQSGYVWINNVSRHYLGVPFGGQKYSGIGREESLEELLDFTQLKSININLRY